MNLEDEIVNAMGKEISEEIDFEVLAGMLEGIGWHRVKLERFQNNHHAVNIMLWCEQHIKNPFNHRGSTFVFEDKGDAINFTLKWL